MATLEIGIRIDMEKGIAFFGVEEANQRIAAGQRVLEIKPGGAIVQEVGSGEGTTNLALSGCQLQVVFEDG